MRFLDLCAGIGGFSLGLEWAGMTCAGQVEIDPYCNKVLEKHWPHVPRWKDLKDERRYGEYPTVDLVCGGYPCQPVSLSGKRLGADDDRYLWPYVFKVVQRLRPAWCLFENVAGHVTLGLDEVLADLEGEGYAARPLVVPACAVDAPHIRARVWILAHAECPERRPPESRRNDAFGDIAERKETAGWSRSPGQDGGARVLANPDGAGCEKRHVAAVAEEQGLDPRPPVAQWGFWIPEPDVGRVAHGVSKRMDRLRALGNAVVPQLVESLGLAILAAEGERDGDDDV